MVEKVVYHVKLQPKKRILSTKTVLLNRMGALLSSYEPNQSTIKRMKQRLKLLELQLKEVNTEIETAIKKDNILSQKVDNICQIKGISLITVATIIAETNGFELFTAREQVVSYAGYDVVQRQSGSSIKGKTKISKKGNKFIRRALYFPAICVVKYEPKFKQMYERIVKKSKATMVAYVAIQRKILLLIYALFKSGKTSPKFSFLYLSVLRILAFRCSRISGESLSAAFINLMLG